jgi:hypothetical protein
LNTEWDVLHILCAFGRIDDDFFERIARALFLR